MSIKFNVSHGFQENLYQPCRGCLGGGIATANTPQSIYLTITDLDNNGNATVVNNYCLYCAKDFYIRKANELSNQQQIEFQTQYKDLAGERRIPTNLRCPKCNQVSDGGYYEFKLGNKF